jgi:Transposase DDE domain group 1
MAVATECHTRFDFKFQPKLVLDFDGGQITSEAGLIVLREFDARLGLTAGLDELLLDQRDRRYVTHSALTLLRQRIYQIAAAYQDANDAGCLRYDPILRAVAAGRDRPLASQPTLSRLENAVPWESIRRFARLGLTWFCRLARHERKPQAAELVRDIDSTADPTHGSQQLSFFNAHYDTYMYHPLLIFEGSSGLLLATTLRAGNVAAIGQLLPLLRPLVTELRRRLPARAIALRAGGEFAKPNLLDYAEYASCSYALGLPRNPQLEACAQRLRRRAEQRGQETGKPVRLYTDFFYQARSWPHSRRIAAKCEVNALGVNLRFVVTNRAGTPEQSFAWYNQRGQAENFIKQLKDDLAADRLSCSAYRANACRLQLHGRAYNLLALLRRLVRNRTELARATVEQVRLHLLKLGARVRRSVRRLWCHLVSGWPGQPLCRAVLKRLAAIRAP